MGLYGYSYFAKTPMEPMPEAGWAMAYVVTMTVIAFGFLIYDVFKK